MQLILKNINEIPTIIFIHMSVIVKWPANMCHKNITSIYWLFLNSALHSCLKIKYFAMTTFLCTRDSRFRPLLFFLIRLLQSRKSNSIFRDDKHDHNFCRFVIAWISDNYLRVLTQSLIVFLDHNISRINEIRKDQ